MAKKQKRMLIERIGAVSTWDFEGNFDQVRETLKKLEEQHPQYGVLILDFDYDHDYGDDERSTLITLSGQREETDVDRAALKLRQAELEADTKALRLAQYEELKKEFGD